MNPAWRDRTQLTRQLQALRAAPNVQGEIFFSSRSFESNPNGWSDSLRMHYYNYPALIPPMSWIDSAKPQEPVTRSEYNKKDSLLTAWLSKGSAGDNLRGLPFTDRRTPISMWIRPASMPLSPMIRWLHLRSGKMYNWQKKDGGISPLR